MPGVRATSRSGRAGIQQPGIAGGHGLYGPYSGHSGRFATFGAGPLARPDADPAPGAPQAASASCGAGRLPGAGSTGAGRLPGAGSAGSAGAGSAGNAGSAGAGSAGSADSAGGTRSGGATRSAGGAYSTGSARGTDRADSVLGVGGPVFPPGHQASVAACMVKSVPRKGGGLADHAHVYAHWEAFGQSAADRARPFPMARSMAGRGTTRGLFCGWRAGCARKRRGSTPLMEREPWEPLDLHVTAFSNQSRTLSNIFKFVMT